jgi:hypothetical protein
MSFSPHVPYASLYFLQISPLILHASGHDRTTVSEVLGVRTLCEPSSVGLGVGVHAACVTVAGNDAPELTGSRSPPGVPPNKLELEFELEFEFEFEFAFEMEFELVFEFEFEMAFELVVEFEFEFEFEMEFEFELNRKFKFEIGSKFELETIIC